MREYQTLDNGITIKTFDDGVDEISDYLHKDYGYYSLPSPRKARIPKPKLLLCFDEDRRRGEFTPSLNCFFGKPYKVIYDHFFFERIGEKENWG